MFAPKAKWSTAAPMLTARGAAPSIVHNGKIYVFGGNGARIGDPLDQAEVYDPKENKWTPLPQIPRHRSNTTLVSVADKIVLLGGYTKKGYSVTEVDVFDTSSQSWELYPPLKSQSTMFPIVLTIDKDIYVLGGANQFGKATTDCYKLEYGASDWETLPSLSTCRYHAKAYHYENKISVIGGRSGREAVPSVDTYDMTTQTWSLKKFTPVPAKRVFSVPVHHKDHVYLFNGLIPPSDFKTNAECYDLKKKKWEVLTHSTFARADTSVCLMNDYVIIVGGMCEYGPNQVVEVFDTNSRKWFTLEEMPTPRISVGVVVVDNAFFAFGGLGPGGPSNKVEVLTFEEQ